LSLGAGFFFAFSDPGAAHGVLCAGTGGGGSGERPHQGGPQHEAASADGARHDHPNLLRHGMRPLVSPCHH
jgi:hypothetical protein